MPPSGYSLRTHAIESLTGIKRPDVPLRVVLRNTAAVILPLGIGLLTGHPQIGLGVGAGALNTMFSDQPGPYRQRLRQLLLAALAAALASLVGFLIGGQLLPMLVATTACGFLGGLLVVFGTDTARVGMTSMILLVVTASTPTSLSGALNGAALIFCGGLLLAAFSLAAWPLQRYRPERHALAMVYKGLATLALQRTHDDTDAPALSEAMTTLQRTLLGRHRAQGRAMEAFGVLLELAERIRLELTAMAELHADPAIHAMFRDDAAGVLAAIADALEHGDSPEQASRMLQALRASERALLDANARADGLDTHIHALAGQLAAAVRNADWAGSRGELRASAAETALPQPLRSSSTWATLRASLTPRSVAFRHAVRTAVCLSIALWISRVLQLPHGYWLPMTAAIVLRPDFAATFNFGLLRVLGTILGLVLTTVLLHITPNEPWAHLALMAVLCMGFRYLATAHYGFAVAALTGTVVILLSFEGVNPGTAVVDRVINTGLGCGMALLAYLAWPTWERTLAREALVRMLEAYAGYLHALVSPARAHARRDSRTAARTARTNAQASIERMRSEPATPTALLALARALFANGNRLARSAMTIEALLDDLAALPVQDEIRRFIDTVADTVQQLATALCERRAPDPLPDLRGLQRALMASAHRSGDRSATELLERISDRLVDNVDTLAHVIKRKGQPAGVPDLQPPPPRLRGDPATSMAPGRDAVALRFYTAGMLKIDSHAHILPRDWPNLAVKYGDDRFPVMTHTDDRHRIYKDGRFFREVWDSAFDPQKRIDDYARFGVNVQVISTVPVLFSYWAPGHQALELHRHLNNHMAELCRDYPRHYAGIGTVPLQAPELAIRELERCIDELGLQGVQVGSHCGDWNLDAPELFPFFEAAADLGAAVLVHPWDMMGAASMPKYWMPWLVGMPAEQARAACCLAFGGVLERLPKLRVMLAHGGGSFPSTIGRIEHGFKMRPDLVATDNPRNPREYLKRFYFDSCVHDDQALRYLLDVTGVEQVMLGTDYPFPLGEQEPGSGIEALGLSDSARARLFHGTALEWLGLPRHRFVPDPIPKESA